MEQSQHKWNLMLQGLQKQLNQETFNTWFKPIVFLGIKEDVIEIQVPNHFFSEHLLEHYGKLLQSQCNNYFNLYKIRTTWTGQESSTAQHTEQQTARPKIVFNTHLSNEYTFDNFVKGEANKFARSIALTIATRPLQTAFNPFFIYGDCGVGKSHLVNAIGLKMLEKNPEKRILYISAHDFLLQYTDSIPKKKFNDFMYYYQSIDCLILDDIHEISGKPGTQEALFNIFNHLKRNGRQIIFTSDKEPSKLEGFEERVQSRFVGGAMAELQRPNEQLRIDILRTKTRKIQLNIPEDVINYIAINVKGNVRDLEGVVNSLLAQSIVHSCEIDLDMAQHIVNRYVRFTTKNITIDLIQRTVCKHYKITQKEINSSSRKKPIVQARQIAMFLAQKHTNMSSTQIGIHIGKRDHSTVLHACNLIDLKIKTNPNFKSEIELIEQEMTK